MIVVCIDNDDFENFILHNRYEVIEESLYKGKEFFILRDENGSLCVVHPSRFLKLREYNLSKLIKK